jgi:transketolase
MTAYKYRLDNLIAIVDWNGIQNDGPIDDIMPLGDLSGKWRTFGWDVSEIDGHDVSEIYTVLKKLRARNDGVPKVILAHTVKGKGISFMEGDLSWHAKPITDDQLAAALSELQWTGGGLDG